MTEDIQRVLGNLEAKVDILGHALLRPEGAAEPLRVSALRVSIVPAEPAA
jgi:hypothetical protein